MNLCRLCGEEKSPLDFNVELSDITSSNWSYRELIEHHTRVSLKTNKLLPQSICEECRVCFDGFVEFANKLQAVQNTFEVDDDDSEPPEVKDCLVEVEVVAAFTESDKQDKFSRALIRKRSKKCDDSEPSEEHVTDDQFANVSPMILQLNIADADRLPDGEILESALEVLNPLRWSDVIKMCQLCDTPVRNISELSSHHDIVHNARDFKLICSMCDSRFTRLFVFINHMTSNHSDTEHLKHCCLVCHKIFYTLEQLHKHAKAKHTDDCREIHQCLFCGEFRDTFSALQKHYASIHSIMSEGVTKSKRTAVENVEPFGRSKRSKREKVCIKVEHENASDKESVDSESDYKEASSSEEKPSRSRMKRETKHYVIHKRSNNPRKSFQSHIFGPEINTFEKLYADELKGISKYSTSLHLNISETCKLPNGEIPEDHVLKVSDLRWKNLLICGICKIPFSSINDLFQHADLKHSTRSKLFQCKSCDGEFTALCESPLINHLVERHFHEHLKFCCLVCSKMFYNLMSLMNHYKTHDSKFELLVCLICGWYAKTLDDLKEHKAFHLTTEKSENQLLCEKVFEKFNSGAEPLVRNHSVAEFEKNPDGTVTHECHSRFEIDWSFGNFQCPACVVSFVNPFELFVHQRLKHPKDVFKKIYSCSLCTDKKDYSNLFTFVNHATSKHLDNAKFTCIVCTKVFWNYLALANHYKDVHPTFPCVFCCHCGKIFMNVTVASSHFKALNLLRTPEERQLLKEGKIQEDPSHICHVCARNFKSRGTLLNHVKTHETLEPSDLLQCHICSKFYKNKYKLAQHMVCHEDLRSWKCKTCGQAFNYKKLLQRHIQAVHENERPFGCTFCEKRFNSKYDLTVHVRLHTGEFPYECPVHDCDAKYPAWSNLFKHCQSRHKLDIRSEGYKKLKATQKTQKTADEYESD